MIKAVLFDMDGVLIDSHDAWFYVFNKSLDKFERKQVNVEEFDKCVWAKAFDKVCRQYFSVPLLDVRKYYQEVYPDYRERLRIMPNAKEALSELKSRGLKLAVVSNTQEVIAKKTLQDIGIIQFFGLILGGDNIKNGKPEPDILYKALELMKLNKDEVLFIGDTIWDKMAAKKANIKFVGFRQDGDKRISSLKELPNMV